jgi:superfamily II DNA/RNA helicase
LIFCNHRDAVDRISELLHQMGIDRETFHGGMEQDERERALLKFRNDSARILITTDLAARGLDIPEVESIVHYQLPPKEDAFIHRNGRTARMNAKGFVYLIMNEDENFLSLKMILLKKVLPDLLKFHKKHLSRRFTSAQEKR